MKKLILFLAVAGVLCAQVVNQPSSGSGGGVTTGSSLPATCTPAGSNLYFLTTGTVGLYQCLATNTWTLVGSGTNALSLSGSIVGTGTLFMDGSHSCGKVVVLRTDLTQGVSSQEIPFLLVPARFQIDSFRLKIASFYAWSSGSSPTVTFSVQQLTNTSSPEIFPATSIMTGVLTTTAATVDRPSSPNDSAHTVSVNFIGSQNFSFLNAGSLEVAICGFVVP